MAALVRHLPSLRAHRLVTPDAVLRWHRLGTLRPGCPVAGMTICPPRRPRQTTLRVRGSLSLAVPGQLAWQRYGESREGGRAGYSPSVAAGRAHGRKHEVPGTDVFMAVVIFALLAVLGVVIALALLGVGR